MKPIRASSSLPRWIFFTSVQCVEGKPDFFCLADGSDGFDIAKTFREFAPKGKNFHSAVKQFFADVERIIGTTGVLPERIVGACKSRNRRNTKPTRAMKTPHHPRFRPTLIGQALAWILGQFPALGLTRSLVTRVAALLLGVVTLSHAATPVAQYAAEGTAADTSGNHHDGTVASDVTFTTGHIGRGFTFPGNDIAIGKNAITIPDSADFKPTNLTVSVWVKFSSLTSAVSGNCPSGQQFILYKENSRTEAQGGWTVDYALVKTTDGHFAFGANFGIGVENQKAVASTTTVVTGRWYHVVCTYDHTSFKLYVNGELEGTTAVTRDLDHAAKPLCLGRTNGQFDGLFNGVMDEVQVFDSALTPAEIPAVVDSNAGYGLVSWWPGNNNTDDIQGGWNGTLQNGATFATTGKVGQAFRFDGSSSSRLVVPRSSSLEPSRVSVDAWVRLQTTGVKVSVLAKSRSSAPPSYGLEILPNGAANFFVFTSPTNVSDRQSTTQLSPNVWYHLAGTWDGTTARIYVNGTEQLGPNPSTSGSGAIDYSGATEFTIGSRAGGAPTDAMNGDVDEVDVFNRALAPAEIQAIYAAGAAGKLVTPPGAGLVAWWRGQDDATDFQGTHHGTLQNGTGFATGKVGQAFSLDGADDYISTTPSPDWNLGANDFTLDGWIYTATPNATMRLISAGTRADGANNLWTFGNAGNRLNFAYWNGSGFVDFYSDPNAIPAISANTWHHIAVARSGSTLSFYFDGAAVGTASIGSMAINGGSTGVIIGARYDASASNIIEFVNGRIDEVDVFKSALSPAEIQAIYDADTAGKSQAPSVSISDVFIAPGASSATFTVSVARQNATVITVDYATLNGTAVAPGDYTATSGTLTIPANATSATITVPVTGNVPASIKTFFVSLRNPTNALINRAYATGTIFTGNAVNDFSTTLNNANGLWQYGYSETNGTGFTLYPDSSVGAGGNGLLYLWTFAGGASVVLNPTTQNQSYNGGGHAPASGRTRYVPKRIRSEVRRALESTGSGDLSGEWFV